MFLEVIKLSKVRNWWWFIDRIGNYEAHMHAITRTIHHENTEFQEVGIVDSVTYGKILVLDGDMQSSQKDEFIYHESLVQPAMMSHPNPEKVLILGGGEGATLREVLRSKTVKKVVMVDIDKRLVEICKEFLPEYSCGAFEDPRAELVITDALAWLEKSDEKFDVIIGDLTDPWPQAPSHGIYSVSFFKLITDRLNEGGLFVTQSSRITFADMHLHNILFETMSKVFPILRTELVYIPGYDMPWSYTIASYTTDPLKISKEEIDSRIAERIGDCLKFYDGEMHHSIFALPKYIRERRKQFLESPDKREERESVFII